ncbi:MAG TPA: pyridoxamine 5'-phosphate oxidase [Bacteroidales bacterium]|nr:pyridoxamine 5'-phosphate oxidase [Bacteroidales bacterium]
MKAESINEKNVAPNPWEQFGKWYNEHLSSRPRIPGVVYLATSSLDGKVTLRTVLLKDFDENGFTFYTNYNSAKSYQLKQNPHAALLFYWPESDRQVRIEGKAIKVPPQVSDEYFKTRPRESQLAAWASDQSSQLPGRLHLENEFGHFMQLYSGKEIPRPEHWGGFLVVPDSFEFWEDREHRLHDRIVYKRFGDSWNIKRLAP